MIEELEDEILNQYLGGRGLGVRILCDNLKKGADPLAPENIMIFTIGPLTSTVVPTSGRFSLVTKSPLTNTIMHSNSGGFWGTIFKRCGFDALYITGKLKGEPGYLLIDGPNVEIKDGKDLWGLTTEKAVEKVREIEGKCQVLVIGPAGENLVRIASVMNQGHRAFGRGGVGAVMGSKKLKAIVVKNGTKKFPARDADHIKQLNIVAFDKIKVFPVTSQALPLFGTAVMMKVINTFGMLPINNNQKGYSRLIDSVSGEKLREDFLEDDEGCVSCPIRCGRLTNTGEMKGKGPEFESLWALGPQCGIFDLKEITHANYLCNSYGLDTISTGNTIACAMELQQRNLLKDSSLKFGKAQILCDFIKKIAYKEDLGEELAEGSLRFSRKYKGTQYAMQIKGMELPAYDPRGAMGQALNFATSNRGACHLTGYLIGMELLGVPKLIDRFSLAKSDQLALRQNQSAVEDSLVVCKFVGFALGFDFQVRFLQAITGRDDITISQLIEIGERIYTLERLFNIREGFLRKDDTLPERFLKEPLREGPSKGRVVPLDRLLEDYYHVRQWNEKGIPKEELLTKLNLIRLK
ncbi:MAG: aldehyde ferredoxin oxidoreductase family protein [Candidatus Helarchaeota archaeon]|nr:aldehyde ferredoxin oxidoreductase family protein [Candidatus Helarchaeota archaeon]